MIAEDIILELSYCLHLGRKPEKELLENTIGLIKHLQAKNKQLANSKPSGEEKYNG